MTWDDVLAYLCTFSSLHTFHERYPDDLKRADGDIAVRFLNSLKSEIAAIEGQSVDDVAPEVDLEWPLALILARRE